ncbi:hypothetical protein HDF16_005737 [Granulicella aggregans]|uniref:Transposase IS66 central domain-containing protein n=1 Tax=Granulicella aggregans TaxID=474949 RepID=A0A7W7ZKQ6_9BACT|nr:transposase [Granulicella aggregans]MBB5061001.1 hypothetical protein [Granulicella aggregans]
MRKELLAGTYIQADETPVAVQKHDGSGTNHQAYLWQYGTPGGAVVFDFRMGRAREGPKAFLDLYQGLLQTDGYAAYDGVGGPGMVHAACWSHARRKFTDALKLNPKDATAARRFQHNPLRAELLQLSRQCLYGCLAILDRPGLISWPNRHVQPSLGNVNTNPYLVHGVPRARDVHPVLALAGYGLNTAQAFIRA